MLTLGRGLGQASCEYSSKDNHCIPRCHSADYYRKKIEALHLQIPDFPEALSTTTEAMARGEEASPCVSHPCEES